MLVKLRQQLNQYIWHSVPAETYFQRQLIQFLRIMTLVVRDLMSGMLNLRAMSLVYTTLLSLVPLIAVSFAMLKGFGVHNQVEPMLENMLTPLGDKGPEITAQIIEFVDNMKMGVLGSVGMVMLLYTVISLIYKIESAFNYTWRIFIPRSPVQRFSSYLSVVIVGPLMMFAAIGMTASLASHTVVETLNQYEEIELMLKFFGYLLPVAMIIAVFTFIYLFVPNIKVNFKSALYGAFFAGIVWEFLSRSFAEFASGSTSYTAIYSGFAILILFMIWLYLGWLVLLTGANIAYYHQHPERLNWDNEKLVLSTELREQMVLQVMVLMAKQHTNQITDKVTDLFIRQQLQIPDEAAKEVLHTLQNAGFIQSSNEHPKQWFVTKSLELISVAQLIHCARETEAESMHSSSVDPIVTALLEQHQKSIDGEFSKLTLASVIDTNVT
ncbi:MAG: YihY family inner membrane protein [Gammaproteobacteria bacterium]|nr:YihY family inner membrane protein [Gammaproteobacteria bacterium]